MANYDFGEEIQDELVYNIITDTTFLKRTEGLIKPEYFDNVANGYLVDIALEHFDKYKEAINIKSLVQEIKDKVSKKIIREDIKDIIKDKLNHIYSIPKNVAKEKLIDEVAVFAKHQAVQNAFVLCVDKLKNNDYDYIEKAMRKALNTGSSSQFETYSYFDELNSRIEKRKLLLLGTAQTENISTGIPDLDACLRGGGWGIGELSLLMGGPKSGKTMGLAEFALNASLSGKNVLYVTLEVSEQIIAERLDANLSDIKINDIGLDMNNIMSVQQAVARAVSKAGMLDIQPYPTGQMKPSDLRRLIEKRQSDTGLKYDLVVVDYADIMRAETLHGFSEKRDMLTSIYEDLRAIAQTYHVAVLTATQTNREGVKAKVADMTHVAEDLGKIRTADIVISINCTEEEKMVNEARLFFAASRTGESDITLKIKRDIAKGKFITKVLSRK